MSAAPSTGGSPWTPGINPLLERRDSLLPQHRHRRGASLTTQLQVLNQDDAVSRIVYEVDVPAAPTPTKRARGDSIGEAPPRSSAFFARPLTLLLARLTILIQRSSGRDKISALIQVSHAPRHGATRHATSLTRSRRWSSTARSH